MPFISVEGLDGAGKSTLIDGLTEEYPDAVQTRFPSADRSVGAVIRKLLAEDRAGLSDTRSDIEELLGVWLFLSDHIDQWNQEIEPALTDNKLVISDRYISSLYATQGVTLTERFDDAVGVLQEFAAEADTGRPDVTLILDVPVEVALSRVDENPDHYETPEMLERKRAVYQRLARESKRVVVLDGTQSPADVLDEAIRAIEILARDV